MSRGDKVPTIPVETNKIGALEKSGFEKLSSERPTKMRTRDVPYMMKIAM